MDLNIYIFECYSNTKKNYSHFEFTKFTHCNLLWGRYWISERFLSCMLYHVHVTFHIRTSEWWHRRWQICKKNLCPSVRLHDNYSKFRPISINPFFRWKVIENIVRSSKIYRFISQQHWWHQSGKISSFGNRTIGSYSEKGGHQNCCTR